MQALYSIETSETLPAVQEALKILDKYLDESGKLFTYLTLFITEVARYAETDARVRSSKHLPNEGDLNVNIKIAGNQLLWQILENKSFQNACAHYHSRHLLDEELVKKTYGKLTSTPEYLEYIDQQSREKKAERKMLEFIFTDLMLQDEVFLSHIESCSLHWDDDVEMMGIMMLHFLQKPNAFDFLQLIGKEKLDFARNLVRSVIEKKEYCLEMITPKLKNWDAERIALLDMILMRMGLCEFLYFETIPTKVTLNEYIDLAKDYSTLQSGQFVNGILDSIHKELQAGGKLKKVDYKKE